ncbi:MAG: cation diffusion facilitator family transporter [Sulfurifustis sp.]
MSGMHTETVDLADSTRYQASRRVTLVSVGLNLVLTIVQVVVGFIGGSQALVADGVHTLSDLISDGIVLFALQHSARDADEEHPYGHGRIETAVTLILGAMLVAVAFGISWRAFDRWLFDPAAFVIPSPLTFWVALVTLGAKEWLYRYTMRTATRFDSAMLRANAWHHRSDAISSLIVLAGIGGAIYGFGYMDAVAAIAVAALIAKIGVELGWQALRELIDTGLEAEQLDAIRDVIQRVGGVRALHLLRTRRVGNQAFVDVHILVDRDLSVSEGHHIGEVVRKRLIEQIAPVSDVMVHIDTEEDGAGSSEPTLPLRDEIGHRLKRYFAEIPQANEIEQILLHYAQDRVNVELRLPLSAVKTTKEAQHLAQRFADAASQDHDIGTVQVYFRTMHQDG